MATTEFEVLNKLRHYYDLGSDVLVRSMNLESKDARKVTRQVAEDTGEKYNEVSRAKQFAELFPPDEFAELYELRRSDGKPMGWGHVTKVLPVQDKERRWSLLRQAAKENWPARTLEEAAKEKVTHRRNRGGGKFSLPTTVEGAVDDILKRSNEWLRWYDQLEWPYEGEISMDELPLELIERLRQVKRAVNGLKNTASSFQQRRPKKKK